ncbi:hypothetical protein FRC07_011499, partial [Ceratobasidium sp. 392]
RAEGSPIHIHVCNGFAPYTIRPPGALSKALKRQASCISSLEQLHSDGSIVCAALDFLARYAAPGTSKSLNISGSDFHEFWRRIKDSIRPLDGLVNLQVGPVGNSAYGTTEQLAMVLSNTPSLQTLWLQNNKLYRREESSLPPIYLPRLNALS